MSDVEDRTKLLGVGRRATHAGIFICLNEVVTDLS